MILYIIYLYHLLHYISVLCFKMLGLALRALEDGGRQPWGCGGVVPRRTFVVMFAVFFVCYFQFLLLFIMYCLLALLVDFFL